MRARPLTRTALGATVMMLGTVLAGPAAAVPNGSSHALSVPALLPYQFSVRAAPLENYLHFFRELDSDTGYSRVRLAHRTGEPVGSARAVGAAYWLLTDDEPCLLGCDPPCPESTPSNPTVASTSNPRECKDVLPGPGTLGVPPDVLPLNGTGSAPRVGAQTPSEFSATGSAQAVALSVGAGVNTGAVGSTSTGSVDRVTGAFTGVARGVVTDIALPGGKLATVTSMLGVSVAPGVAPKVDYLLSLVTWDGAGMASKVDQQSFTIGGNQIPLVDLVRNVNAQLAALGERLGSLIDLGVRVLEPVDDYTVYGTRFRVSAPVLVVGVDPDVSLPAPTGASGLRIGSAVFEGGFRNRQFDTEHGRNDVGGGLSYKVHHEVVQIHMREAGDRIPASFSLI